MNVTELMIAFILSFAVTLFFTPIVRLFAFKFKVVDYPDNIRKKHKQVKPYMGGLAIFFGASAGFIVLQPKSDYIGAIIIGAFIMLLTGFLDDLFNLKPYQKLLGQLGAALIVVNSGLIIDKLSVPFFGIVQLGYIGTIITIFWIILVSNAINLIDGLDGLASGVSTIALSSILVIAVIDQRMIVVALCIILVGANMGFLPYNFYPAKIFMGDTGALFLGYSIAIVSMLGLFKKIAFFSFIVPIIVIAIPIFDTTQAVIRRIMKKQSIAEADHKHIHYKLMEKGYSHRTSVLIIYVFSIFFGAMAIIFSNSTLLSSLVIFIIILIGIQLIAEISGMTFENHQPILNWLRKFFPIDKWILTLIKKQEQTLLNFDKPTKINK